MATIKAILYESKALSNGEHPIMLRISSGKERKYISLLGVSAISDTGNAFVQNNKTLQEYYDSVLNQILPVHKGYLLNEEDIAFRRYILDLSCKGETLFDEDDLPLLEQYTFPELEELARDGQITWSAGEMEITPLGRNFIRNICKAFDLHLLRNTRHQSFFSKAI